MVIYLGTGEMAFLIAFLVVLLILFLYNLLRHSQQSQRSESHLGANSFLPETYNEGSSISLPLDAEALLVKPSRDVIREKINQLVLSAQNALENAQYSVSIEFLTEAKQLAEEYDLHGFLQIITQRIAYCENLAGVEEKQKHFLHLFQDGNTVDAYLGLCSLMDEMQQHQATKAHPSSLEITVMGSLTAHLSNIEQEFQQDKSRIFQMLEKLDELLETGKFYVVGDRLTSFGEFCHNLRFTEIVPIIEQKLEKTKKNRQFHEKLTKELHRYELGQLRNAYNALDVLERQSKLAKNENFLTVSLHQQIEDQFSHIRKELKLHKDELNGQLWKVFQLINSQDYEQASGILDEIEKGAKKYDFYYLLRDVADQRNEIKKFQTSASELS